MSRMINNGKSVCTFNGGAAGSNTSEASGMVIGLDAVVVLASAETGAAAACNGAGGGLALDGTNGQGFGNCKDVLICGNRVVELFEECDPSAPATDWVCSVPGATRCSSTCRC